MRVTDILKYIFALVGTGMLIGAFYLYQSTGSFLEEATTADGTVVDFVRSRSSDSTTYAPVIHFIDRKGEKIEFTSSTSSNPPSYTKGEKVEVLYLPAQPQKAKINGFFALWGGVVILGGMGSVFLLIATGIILFLNLKGRRDKYLKSKGTPIETDFQSVELNQSFSVNGRHPFRVLTQWQNPSTSEVHVFKSNNLWFDPSNYIKIKRITVFIERNNPKKYYVDLSFLPKVAD